jgi:hypothetical protein
MKNLRCVVLLVCLFSGYSFAQVSGYMGKRFSIGYSNYFMAAGFGPVANAESNEFLTGINSTHCLNLEYTIAKRINFCLSLQTLKTGVNPTKSYYVQNVDPNSSYSLSTSVSYSPKPYLPMQLRTINIGLGCKFFHFGTLAPVGKYNKLEILLFLSHLTYDKDKSFPSIDSNGKPSYYQFSGDTGDYQFKSFALAFTMGRSRVFWDKIVLDYGLRLAISNGIFTYMGNALWDDTGNSSYGSTDITKAMRQDVNKRIFREQLVNFHIGISFLAF